jgi:ABC-2 type transport system ATP-binding protein
MAELSGLGRQDALERTHEALNYVGLGEARYRAVGTYSMGMRQLVKLAQAIVHGPRLLLLDEPTNALDPPARHRMLEIIRDIRDSGDVAVIVSSHLLRDVESACDDVAILREGRLVAHQELSASHPIRSDEIEVETAGDPGPLAAALSATGCEVSTSLDRRVTVKLRPDQDTRHVYVVATSVGVQVRRLSGKRDTLEDIFLAAMAVPDFAAPDPASPDGAAPDAASSEPLPSDTEPIHGRL